MTRRPRVLPSPLGYRGHEMSTEWKLKKVLKGEFIILNHWTSDFHSIQRVFRTFLAILNIDRSNDVDDTSGGLLSKLPQHATGRTFNLDMLLLKTLLEEGLRHVNTVGAQYSPIGLV
ncbi:hypothetical protein TNCV_2869591 [Trichonephila clavipes]|nr:hypothetical protein TNCV_2869591 [Trichonephila clavipes]